MTKAINRLGPFVVVEGDVDGRRCFWLKRDNLRIGEYGSREDADEYASLLY